MGLLDYFETPKVANKLLGLLREKAPEVYGSIGGLLGTAPDQFEGSVLDPMTARVRSGAEAGFPVGTALQIAPLLAGLLNRASSLPSATGMKQRGGVNASKKPFVYPQDEALEKARQNGVKMLGLPENNTPLDRAKALGFSDDVYHSTLDDLNAFSHHGKFTGHHGVSGVSVTDSPEMASRYLDRYAEIGWVDGVPNQPFSKNVMPLMIRKGNALEAPVSPYRAKAATNLGSPLPTNYKNPMHSDGIDTLVVPDAISRRGAVKHSDAKNAVRGKELIAANPAQLRSRFAAFDPARINENNLLAGSLPFMFLGDENNNGLLRILEGAKR